MFRYRSQLSVLILVVLAISLVGCGDSDYRKQERYYLVAANIKLPYWQSAKAGLRRAGAEVGVGTTLVGPDTYDPKAQEEEFQKIVLEQPAGILVSVTDSDLMKDEIDAAIAQGINVITIDADDPSSKRLFFVGTDNYSVGAQVAEVAAEQLQRAGTVIVYTIEGQSNLEDRLRGCNDVFATYPAIRVIETVDIKGDPTIAFDTTKELLTKDPMGMDAFVCLEAIACAEIAEVLSRRNMRDKVVIAMDTSERTLHWIQQGLIHSTIGQRPYTMAYVGMRLLADLQKYPPANMETEGSLSTVPDFVDTGVVLVDKSNVERFLAEQQSNEN